MSKIFTEAYWLNLLEMSVDWLLTELPSILLVIVIFIFAIKFFNKLTGKINPFLLNRKYLEKSNNKEEAKKRINTLVRLSENTIRVVLWAVFVIILLSKFKIDVAPLLASAGIVGLAIGFGAQELVRDFISGIFIFLENQIRIGDIATINSISGTIEKLELRTITLRDFTGTVHIFQNGKVATLANQTKDWSAAVFEIGIAYKENVAKVIDLMNSEYENLKNDEEFTEKILEKIEIFGLERFDNSAVVIKARIKTKPAEQWGIKREYQNRLKSRFDHEQIEIPFPHTTLYWGEKTPPLKIELDKN